LGTLVEHGQTGKPANNVNDQSQQLLHAFFEEIATLALRRAARAVRQFVAGELDNGSDDDADQALESLRDVDVDVIDLPPSFTKRSMHKRFVLDCFGWAITWNSNGRRTSKTPAPNKPQVEPILAWSTFYKVLEQQLPKDENPKTTRRHVRTLSCVCQFV